MVDQAYLGDVLAGYAYPDNWRRSGGAERASYQYQPSLQPVHFLLQNRSELWKPTQLGRYTVPNPSIFEPIQFTP
jgi:hypothetical protein